jgi:hypothetical protein
VEDEDMGFNPFGVISDAVRAVGHVAEDGGKALEDGGKAFEGAMSKAANVAEKMSPSALGHTALDLVGMVPVVGSVANLANAGWYAAGGDWADAAASAAAAIPLAGDGVDAAKLGDDALKLGGDAVKAEEAATTGAKVLKAGKTMLPVAAAAPGAINAGVDAARGDWKGAALSAASIIPVGHLADRLPGVAQLSERAVGDARATEDVASGDDKVWVQLNDGRIREYKPGEVAEGNPALHDRVTTPEGSGEVVARGDPPNKGDVRLEKSTDDVPPLTLRQQAQAHVDRIRAEVKKEAEDARAEAARHGFRSSGARSGQSKGAKENIEIGRRTIEFANTIKNKELREALKVLGRRLEQKGGGDRHLM